MMLWACLFSYMCVYVQLWYSDKDEITLFEVFCPLLQRAVGEVRVIDHQCIKLHKALLGTCRGKGGGERATVTTPTLVQPKFILLIVKVLKSVYTQI